MYYCSCKKCGGTKFEIHEDGKTRIAYCIDCGEQLGLVNY